MSAELHPCIYRHHLSDGRGDCGYPREIVPDRAMPAAFVLQLIVHRCDAQTAAECAVRREG